MSRALWPYLASLRSASAEAGFAEIDEAMRGRTSNCASSQLVLAWVGRSTTPKRAFEGRALGAHRRRRQRAQQRAAVAPVDPGVDVEAPAVGGERDRSARCVEWRQRRATRRLARCGPRSPTARLSSARVPRRARRSPPRCPRRPRRAACPAGRPRAGCRARRAPRGRSAFGRGWRSFRLRRCSTRRKAFSSRRVADLEAGRRRERRAVDDAHAERRDRARRSRRRRRRRARRAAAARDSEGLTTTSASATSPGGRRATIAASAAFLLGAARGDDRVEFGLGVLVDLANAASRAGCRGTRSSAACARAAPGWPAPAPPRDERAKRPSRRRSSARSARRCLRLTPLWVVSVARCNSR